MTKFRICSDLHLEFEQWELPELSTDSETVLILAGDIGLATRESTYVPFIETVAARFQQVIMILGNHEFYHGSINTARYDVEHCLCHVENFILLDDEVTEVGDVTVIGSTLWTDFNKNNPVLLEIARTSMNDYYQIRIGPNNDPYQRRLTPIETSYLHNGHKIFIFEEIRKAKEQGRKVVVVTHHLPSFLSVDPQYTNSNLNGAYATELFDEIEELQPELWIHGHTHSSVDYKIIGTRVICNPRGYPVDIGLNTEFNPTLLVDV